ALLSGGEDSEVDAALATRSQTIAAVAATLSDSAPRARSGIVIRASQRARTSSGSPSRSEPRQIVAASPRSARVAPPGATIGVRGAGVASIAALAGGRAKIDPMLARTAFGEKGSAQSGPRTTVPSISAWAVRTIAPTLPGSPTP